MNQQRGGEARLEVALAQAIINEVKYGSETNQLAEVSLLAAFQNRVVGEKLAHALLVLMPGLQYFSIGALLKDGVTVSTSNLVIPGPINISARSLRGTAARIAARKNSTLHVKRRVEHTAPSKYFELQEVWEQVGATSVLSIPIPAVRNYESASITEAPAPVEEPALESAGHTGHVLHNTNGAIGVVTVGLATENIDLNGRQGKALQAMAQSLSPFLAYYAASALEELHREICDVASANAASIAKFRARQQQAEQRRQSFENDVASAPNKEASADGQTRSGGARVMSPFSAASDPKAKWHSADQSAKAAPPPQSGESTCAGAAPQGHNPFAQAATFSFSESPLESTPGDGAKPEQQKQPVSPFATAAEAPGRSFDTRVHPEQAGGTSSDQSAMPRPDARRGSASSGSQSETGGSVNQAFASSSGDMAGDAAHQVDQAPGYSLDTPFVFKRKPVSSAHVRRYSTSTFFQGVLHTPKGHLSHLSSLSNMVTVPEDSAPAQQQQQLQQTVFVDDFTYASVARQVSRRAFSTPSTSQPAGGLPDVAEVQGRMQALGSCPGPFLGEGLSSDVSAPDAKGSVAAARAHLALLGQISKAGGGQGAMAEQASLEGMTSSTQMGVPWRSGSPSSVDEPHAGGQVSHVENIDFEMNGPVKHSAAPSSGQSDAVIQHPLWLTFLDSHLEEQFGIWMGQRCSKVDTIFMLAATVYITQLLFYTWALADQQAKKWPLLGYTMLPVLLLQHGDTAWYLKHRSTIVTTVRCVLLAFLTCLVPAIVEGSDAPPSRWIDSSGLWPLVVISLGLLVRFKVHLVVHAISCASLVLQGLCKCTAEPHSSRLGCHVSSIERLAVVTCIPTVFLYVLETHARLLYLQSTKH